MSLGFDRLGPRGHLVTPWCFSSSSSMKPERPELIFLYSLLSWKNFFSSSILTFPFQRSSELPVAVYLCLPNGYGQTFPASPVPGAGGAAHGRARHWQQRGAGDAARQGSLRGFSPVSSTPYPGPSPKGREVKAHCRRTASPQNQAEGGSLGGLPQGPPGRRSTGGGGRRSRRFSETSCGVPTFYRPSFFHLKIFTKLDQINILKWNFLVSKQFLT